jgi:hypothetical protein
VKERLPIVLSVTALVIALLGVTGLGEAALRAVPVANFALNAGKVNGIKASKTPEAGKLLALNGSARFPKSVLAVPTGPRGLAGATGPAGPQGPQGPAGPAGPAGQAPVGGVVASKTVTGSAASSTAAAAFVDLPGGSTTVDIATGQTGQVVVTFSGESVCYGGTGWCTLRILIDGSELAPSVGTNFAFDSTDNNTETSSSWESHAIQRVSATLASGSHTVQVQWGVSGVATFELDDWALNAQLVRLT